MSQLTLDYSVPARSRRTDPQTSRDAAARVNAPNLADRVLIELRVNGPGTSREIAERMKLSLVTVSPRLKPLEDAGEVQRTGRRNGMTVWAAI